MSDEIQYQEQRAARVLANRIRHYVVAGTDPDGLAAAFIRDLRAEGWRPPLKPPPDRRTRDPGSYERGLAEARAALAEALKQPDTDTPRSDTQ